MGTDIVQSLKDRIRKEKGEELNCETGEIELRKDNGTKLENNDATLEHYGIGPEKETNLDFFCWRQIKLCIFITHANFLMILTVVGSTVAAFIHSLIDILLATKFAQMKNNHFGFSLFSAVGTASAGLIMALLLQLVMMMPSSSVTKKDEEFSVFVTYCGTTYTVQVKATDNVEILRQKIGKVIEIEPGQIGRIRGFQKELTDEKTLKDCGIQRFTNILLESTLKCAQRKQEKNNNNE
ncbi:hypothetical protein niasHS_018074 [Heterodera schachtii]|uniref:Ubiquitin-like domain-containing protein n=1 Tax=Heterodera schachtii TaxID=97005 RepID=A0ABD2HP99_HETSC